MKYYAPLSWIHLGESLRPSTGQIRISLNQIPKNDSKCLAQLFFGNQDTPVTDPYKLTEANLGLSVRQKACIKVFAHADPFSSKRDRYILGPQQLATLLLFAGDVTLEVKGVGSIVQSSKPARIQAVLDSFEEEHFSLHFQAVDFLGNPLKNPSVVGLEEAYLLDEHLVLHRLEPPLLPLEASSLLTTENLPVGALYTEEAKATLAAIAELGVDLTCLNTVAKDSNPPLEIILRALIHTSKDTDQVGLRIHLVTSLHSEGLNDEVEIPSKGALTPVFPLVSNEELHLLKRDNVKEEEARSALFDIGALAATTHRGFKAEGQRALDVLSKIVQREGLPKWLSIDEDTLPTIIHLPEKPTLSLSALSPFSLDQLSLQVGFGFDNLNFSLEHLLQAAKQQGHAFLHDNDTVITFQKKTVESLSLISDALEMTELGKPKNISFLEAAMLIQSLDGRLEISCETPLREKLIHFIPEILPEDTALPACLQTTLRPYQHDAVTWMSQLHRAKLGRLLADDMGLGKTLMVLCLLAKVKEQYGPMPSLVVAPTSVIDVWVSEAKKHFSGLNVMKWHGADRSSQTEQIKDADILVTSYALLRRDTETFLSKFPFRYLIMDEAQNVKNPRTESWKAARTIQSEQRIALTGTPVENRVLDLYSIVELITPSLLGSETSFNRRYAQPISQGQSKPLLELKERLKPIILRRKKIDVESDLPPKIESVLRCEMQAEQVALYRTILQAARRELTDILQGSGSQRGSIPLLAALTRLRQVCCDPRLIVSEPNAAPIPSAKAILFNEVIGECLSMGRKVIIYSQFVKMQQIILEMLAQNGVHNALWLHGGTRNRAEIVEKFQSPDGPPVIVVSLKAGGTGITLTAADTVIYYDPWWNPAVLDQAADRAHRIGQTKAVHLIKLICENSLEEQILALSEKKREMAKDMLSEDKPGLRSLTLDDIKSLLSVEIDRFSKWDENQA